MGKSRLLLNVKILTDIIILGLETKSKIQFASEPNFFNFGFKTGDDICIRQMSKSSGFISILTIDEFKTFIDKNGTKFLEFFNSIFIKDYQGEIRYACSENGKKLDTSIISDEFIIKAYDNGKTIKPTIFLSYDADTIVLTDKNINKQLKTI